MKYKNHTLGFIFILLGIILDQVVKIIIRLNMEEKESITLINHFFSITHVENSGAAWGGFSGYTIILIIVSIIILGFFVYLYRKIDFKNKIVFSISLVMVIGGTLGNMIDRIIFQHVTDFLDFEIFGYDFPVFNIADILLVVGFALFIFDMVFLDKDDKKEIPSTETDSFNEVEELKEENSETTDEVVEEVNEEVIESEDNESEIKNEGTN